MKVSVLEFLKSGKFGKVKIDHKKEEVLKTLPKPDIVDYPPYQERKCCILTYGSIELHFIEDVLCLIHADNFIYLDGGEVLKIDFWVLDGNASEIKLEEMIENLSKEKVKFSLLKNKELNNTIIKTEGNVELLFEQKSNSTDYFLEAISLQSKKHIWDE